jgi:hypothetical protein
MGIMGEKVPSCRAPFVVQAGRMKEFFPNFQIPSDGEDIDAGR